MKQGSATRPGSSVGRYRRGRSVHGTVSRGGVVRCGAWFRVGVVLPARKGGRHNRHRLAVLFHGHYHQVSPPIEYRTMASALPPPFV